MEGLAAVTARIAEIRSMGPAAFGTPAPVASPGSGEAFATAFATANGGTSAGAGSAALRTADDLVAGILSRPPALQPGATAVTPARPGAKATPPAELRAYGNGKVPAEALMRIGHGEHRLWGPAANGFSQLEAAAARDGVKIKVTDSYRSFEQQVDVAKRKGLYSQGGLAATPGTSNHGWGLSLDLDLDPKALSWMRANAATYGFVEDVPREPWHWTFASGG